MDDRPNEPDLLSDGLERVADAAKWLGVSKSLVYTLIRNGVLPSVLLGNSRRVPIRAVREFARQNVVLNPKRVG